jgi:fatty-acyl-CoA synthase
LSTFTFSQLTPTAFLERSARVFPERLAIIDGDRRFSYGQFADRSRRLAGGLAARGIAPGDRVAALCANSSTMLEAHHGVPWAGGVLVPLNVRLAAEELGYILRHSGASLLLADQQFADTATEVAGAVGIPVVVAGGPEDEYEQLLAGSEPLALPCPDEANLLALNYTSGTTGRPKGVMYAHRGAHLQALAMAQHTGLGPSSRYLWTLPMFHCDGWCFPWAVTAAGAVHVCLPAVDATRIWQLLREAAIPHYSAAPTVLTMILDAEGAAQGPVQPRVEVQTGGAPPSPTVLARMSALNMDVTHLYGLTETYGPLALNQWHPEWDDLPVQEQARLKARQGVGNVIADPLRVVQPQGADVPRDAATVGEIVARGNDVMLGYYQDEEATTAATFTDPEDGSGWFRTGDLAVVHPDGYIEIRDRGKDIIISGGENISSVEIERVLDAHPAVVESAVVAESHEKWGEVPVAYVTLRADVDDAELASFVRSRLAGFKVPKRFVHSALPKTSTGKIQKNRLRARSGERPETTTHEGRD